jgi:hypothetical protein
LVQTLPKATGARGEITWDRTKPDGTTRKQLDLSWLAALGWRVRIPLVKELLSMVWELPGCWRCQGDVVVVDRHGWAKFTDGVRDSLEPVGPVVNAASIFRLFGL